MPLELSPDQEGLQKLVEYLAQTRRQAEQAIDVLNKSISELQEENDVLRKNCEEYLNERDFFKNSCEQLKLENSKKWRLQERDDWKALVDSVQRDRTRLQQENLALEAELAECKHTIEELQLQLTQTHQTPNGIPRNDSSSMDHSLASLSLDIEPPASPSSTPRHAPMTPTTTSRTLKLELERTQEQVVTLQRSLDEEKLRSESEIHKLKDELHRARTSVSRQHSNGSDNMPQGWPGFFGYYSSTGEKVVRKGRDILTV